MKQKIKKMVTVATLASRASVLQGQRYNNKLNIFCKQKEKKQKTSKEVTGYRNFICIFYSKWYQKSLVQAS